MASIYQRKDGTWDAVARTHRADGAPWKQHFQGRTYDEALRKLHEGGFKLDETDSTPALVDQRMAFERSRAALAIERAELKKLLSAKDSADAYRDVMRRSILALPVPDMLEPFQLSHDKPTHTWVLTLSDIHVGQKTTIESTGEMFEQSTERVKEQFDTLWKGLLRLWEIDRHGKNLSKLVILLLGDIVEGDGMRPSQAMGIDLLVVKQAVTAADLLREFIRRTLTIFNEVEVQNVGGNHDRTSPKPGNAGLGELGYADTYAWLIGEFLRMGFDDNPRLKIKNWESFFGTAIIANQRTVFEHGASFRTSTGSYGGVPYYPISNAADKYRQMLDGADLVVFGHFHIPAVLPMGRGWQVLNGSFTPSTNWVQSSFKRVGTPTQMLLDLHPKYGLLQARPIYLPHDGIAEPGAIWEAHRAAQD